MPLITFDSPVARISGRLGTAPNTYTFNNGAPVIRAQVGPSNPDSDDQQAIRAIFSAVTKNWKLLTQAQRTAWVTWAQSHDVQNRLGRTVTRNGISAYVELATAHYIDTAALLTSAPVLARPAAPTSIDFTVQTNTIGQFDVTINHTYTVVTGLFVVCRTTPPFTYQSQTPKLGDYRLACGVTSFSIRSLTATGDPYTFSPARYDFSGSDGMFAGCEITIMNAEGWQSVPVRDVQLLSIP